MEWTIEQAKGRLKEVIDLALRDDPQEIRAEDGSLVVITRKTNAAGSVPKKNFLEFLMSAPSLEGLDISRDKSLPRHVDFGGEDE
jgi:hypothetical protein